MKLFFVNGLRAGEELEFILPEITVGRELDNVVIIPVEGVSRYHGKFRLQSNGKWTVEDTGSTNGIKCNRVKIQSQQELQEGDLVEFGNQMIRVTGLVSAAAPVVFSTLDGNSAPEPAEEIKITPPPQPAEEIKITPPPQPAAEVKTAPPPAQPAAPKGQSVRELSEALKNGKLHLFGGSGKADAMHTQFGGTAPESEDTGTKRKLHLSNRIYYTVVICLAIMGIAFFYRINNQPAPVRSQTETAMGEANAKRFMLYYEKQIITPDNVFLFILHIENGEAKFQIDDLKSSRSFTRSQIPFTQEAYEKFQSDLEYEHFFKTRSPKPTPDSGGRRDYRRMVICDQGRLHELVVRNNMRPTAFERLETSINLFAENHALRTVSMTPEELQDQALMNFNKAEDLFQNRQSRAANLRDSIHRYRLTVEYLNAFDPKPELWDKARKQLELASKIRDDRLAALRSERVRLGQLREFAAVLPVLDEIMALSDPDSPEFSDARKLRIQIDSYLRKNGGRRK